MHFLLSSFVCDFCDYMLFPYEFYVIHFVSIRVLWFISRIIMVYNIYDCGLEVGSHYLENERIFRQEFTWSFTLVLVLGMCLSSGLTMLQHTLHLVPKGMSLPDSSFKRKYNENIIQLGTYNVHYVRVIFVQRQK